MHEYNMTRRQYNKFELDTKQIINEESSKQPMYFSSIQYWTDKLKLQLNVIYKKLKTKEIEYSTAHTEFCSVMSLLVKTRKNKDKIEKNIYEALELIESINRLKNDMNEPQLEKLRSNTNHNDTSSSVTIK